MTTKLMMLPEQRKTLNDIVADALSLTRALVESKGELTPELEDKLNKSSLEIASKVDAYVYIEERMEYEGEYWDRKSKDFAAIAKSFKTAKERLRERVKFAMGELQKDEIKGVEYRFKLSKSKPRLILNPEILPNEYKMQVTDVVPDKEKIQAALNEGFEVPGAHLEPVMALRVYENPDRE